MKALFVFIICFFILCSSADAIGRKHRYNGAPKTEVELMTKVLECLQNKDTIGYYNLFPPFDSLWQMVIHNPDPSIETQRELNKLREHPTVLLDLDPFYNHTILGRFEQTIKKGEDSGMQWSGVVTQRFELQRQNLSRGMEGLQHVVPERFKGYLFVRDMSSSTTFCITIAEIQKINGYYCGGQVLNVLEASDIDQFIKKEAAEQRHFAKLEWLAQQHKSDSVSADATKVIAGATDSAKIDSSKTGITINAIRKSTDTAKGKKDLLLSVNPPDDEANRNRREVVDRKYYQGKFDDEIPVELYVRYMKDLNGKVTKYWDALYKFGDMAEYVKLDVSKSDEDKWLFEEPVASMELELNGKVYTGSWTNGENQTGYDAELPQKEISQKKIMELDLILENGLWGKTNEQKIAEKEGDSKDGTKKETRRQRRKRKEKEEEKDRQAEEKAIKDKKDSDTKKDSPIDPKKDEPSKKDTPPTPLKSDGEKDGD